MKRTIWRSVLCGFMIAASVVTFAINPASANEAHRGNTAIGQPDVKKNYTLSWRISGDYNRHVTFMIEGSVSLTDNRSRYHIRGLLSILEGHGLCDDIGNPKMFVRRNGVDKDGDRWGWQKISDEETCNAVSYNAVSIKRDGDWDLNDRKIQLDIGADPGWLSSNKYSDNVEVELPPRPA